MPGAPEGTVRFEPAPSGSEGLVEVRDVELHSCRDFGGDLGEVHHHIQRRVCSPSGEGTVGIGVFVPQAGDEVCDCDYTDVPREGVVLP